LPGRTKQESTCEGISKSSLSNLPEIPYNLGKIEYCGMFLFCHCEELAP
jgi:hypothetical protein